MAEQFQSSSWHRVAEIAPRLRSHGQIRHHRYRERSWYVLHDPSSGRVHRFTPATYAFIRAMDGTKTVDQLWSRMATELEADAPTQDEIIRLLSQLYEADMLQVDRLPNAEAFFHLVARHRRSWIKNAVRNPLSVTVPLWDPDAFLKDIAAACRSFLSWGGLLAWLIWVVPALILAALHMKDLTTNATDRLLSTEGLILMALTFPIVKAIHEMGHALSLKALGGEVHQIGLMFIAFYPVPYVEASAAAMLPGKDARILVSAAGMMLELILAAGAMYVWLLVEPGLVRAIAFDVIVIAGVSTLIVNGNPLLRFDGYFMLSDAIEIPNLAQRSTRFWSKLTMRALFGLKSYENDHPTRGEKAWFMTYGPASWIYRLLVLISLSLFIASEYFIVGVVFAIVAMFTAIVMPLARGIKRVLQLGQLQAASRRTKLRLAATVAALGAGLFVIPAPLHTTAEGVIWLPEDAYVRAGTDGFITRIIADPGATVHKGALLVESEDVFLSSQITLNHIRVQELEQRHASERFANRVLAEITQMEIAEEKTRLTSNLEKRGSLVARSERDGTLLIPQALNLPGRFVRKGEVIGYVLPDESGTIRSVVLQDNIDLVRHRLKSVSVKLAGDLETAAPARIIREVPAAADEVPSKALTIAGGGAIAVDPKDPKGLKVAHRLFQFDLQLERGLIAPPFGAHSYIRFEHVPEPIASQAFRRLRQLFLSRFNA